jgi:hypothetical protein
VKALGTLLASLPHDLPASVVLVRQRDLNAVTADRCGRLRG